MSEEKKIAQAKYEQAKASCDKVFEMYASGQISREIFKNIFYELSEDAKELYQFPF